ncbi:MAG: hypothetical protein RQ867_07170 [Mariprofundaceae bacterium]|nr:hypothetical protein [Mariprofundaceae bacterium]
MTVAYSIHDRFALAAACKAHCRIVYRDDHGEHHAVMAMPKEWRKIDGIEWGFFDSEAGVLLEVRLEDILAIEMPEE